jgi:tRNA dimethylallyltransferase
MTGPAVRERLPPVIALLGPTGSGKSALAMQLAQQIPAEIISVDSAQVFRGMDIGTAKPTLAERAAVPHHLIDIREPEAVYSAGEFRGDCLPLIEQIRARGRVPILVGGTMLYFRALFRGLAQLPGADADLRKDIDARARASGWPALHAELARLDPAAAARIHHHDAQRIQRLLEIVTLSGKAVDEHWHREPGPMSAFGDWRIGVLLPPLRAQLHQRLEQRLRAMFASGFVGEVSALLARGTLEAQSPALRLVGYRQLIEHCRGLEPVERAFERALSATRQLARRQMTWLRGGYLLPEGALILRIDPFDGAEMERLMHSLIEEQVPS